MKRFNILAGLFLLMAAPALVAQAPNMFKYQSVIRDNSGEILANKTVSLRFSILQDSETGISVFKEMHNVATNNLGLVSVNIGQGTPILGTLGGIPWGDGPFFLRIEVDRDGGSNYVEIGASQLLSVPYALYSNYSLNGQAADNDADTLNEIQTISVSEGMLTLSKGGGSVILPGGDNWGSQIVHSDTTLTGDGTTVSPLGLARMGAAPGQVLTWTGTAWHPGAVEELHWFTTDDHNLSYSTANNLGYPLVQITSPSSSSFLEINKATGSYYALTLYSSNKVVKGSMGLDDSDNLVIHNGNFGLKILPNGHTVIDGSASSVVSLNAPSQDAILNLNRAAGSRYSAIGLQTTGITNFWAGLLTNNNFRISTNYNTLNGIEVTPDGDLNMTDNLNVEGEVNRPPTGNANLVPVAYGIINAAGDPVPAYTTDNVTCTWKTNITQYELTVTGGVNGCIILITPNMDRRIPTSTVGSDHFTISFHDLSGNLVQSSFFFMVYRK